MYSTTDSIGRLMRWRMRLAEFDFELKYKRSASHYLPGFFSRDNHGQAPDDINNDISCLACAETAQGLRTERYTGTSDPEPVEFDDFIDKQQ